MAFFYRAMRDSINATVEIWPGAYPATGLTGGESVWGDNESQLQYGACPDLPRKIPAVEQGLTDGDLSSAHH